MKRTLTNVMLSAIVATQALACMSDDSCGDEKCCYMNTCVEVGTAECSSTRMQIFKALNEAEMKTEEDVKRVVS